jgi:biopolymer transport protein ExbD
MGIILILISLATFLVVHQWMSSRTFVATDIPISLGRGRIKAGPFKINLRNYYRVEIDTGWERYSDPNCPTYDRLKARWSLYKDGRLFASGDGSDPYTSLGGFVSEKGSYKIELEVLSDTACLDPGGPRLVVSTNKSDYEDNADPVLWASVLGIALGGSLVALGGISRLKESDAQSLRVSPLDSVGQSFQWAQRLALQREFSSPPAFALIAAPGLIILIIIFMVLLEPYPFKGLFVQVQLKADSTVEAGFEPIIVHVVDAGPNVAPRVYVNAKPTSWEGLSNTLRDELKLRPKWVVYVEADPQVAWADAVQVVGVAKALHAKAVLLTANDP